MIRSQKRLRSNSDAPALFTPGDQNGETGPVQVVPEQVDNIGLIFNYQDSILHGYWALPKLA